MPRLLELFGLAESLSDGEREDLMMLQHSKELLGGGRPTRIPALDRAIQLYGRPTPRLWRGLAPDDGLDLTASRIRAPGYLSFSEERSVADSFAEETGVVLELESFPRAFCYYRWIEEEMLRLDPEEYEAADGDGVIEMAFEEAEWILPYGASLVRLRERREGRLTVVTVRG